IPPYVYVISACTVGFIYTPIVLLFSIPLLGTSFIRIAINLLPVIVLWYMFALGLSILLASLAVYIRDISQVLGPALNFLFYSVPIIYPYSLVPENIKPIIKLNPLFYMVEAIYLQAIEFNLKAIIFCLLIAVIALSFGVFVYRYMSVGFLDVL
ncbi:MAG: ABC transporter permease, partial [Candidatus Kryptonium sp.]